MENPIPIEISLEEESGATSKTRPKNTRSRAGNSSSNSNPDVNAAVIQQVSSLKASLATQQEQIAASNAQFSKLSDMMTHMSNNFEKLMQQPRAVGPEPARLPDSDSGEAEEPASDPFAGIFDEDPVGEAAAVSEDVWSSMLSSTEAPAEFGTDLPVDIAASMQNVCNLEPTAEKVKAMKTRYLIPANAKCIKSPRVNPEIWSLLEASHRSHDQQYQNCQTLISLSLVAQARALATIRSWHSLQKYVPAIEIVKRIGEVLMDSVSCTGGAQRNLNMKRRGLIQQAVPALKPVSFSRVQPTEFLFGDRIHEELKTAKAAQTFLRVDFDRKRRPNSGAFGQYSGRFWRESWDKRARPQQSTLNLGRDTQRPRSSGARKLPPPAPENTQ